ncbi:hypothetical protein [Pseudarthrobacter sp. efr-133-R2A-89]|uniref:hypothetical protein n=1 Tax=Pseudarthrobacter sp. efr-133-R2A-89 TaxID=3040302 RepID=UPI002553F89F|nr:hypothetical protein [Pseudarthrobacter sp. efr-133-R2A-89]
MGNDLTEGIWGSAQRTGGELEQLTGRISGCEDLVEQVLAGIRDTQLLNWESPAGRAYRDAVSVQAAALHSAIRWLEDARHAVGRRAGEQVALLPTGSGWPG